MGRRLAQRNSMRAFALSLLGVWLASGTVPIADVERLMRETIQLDPRQPQAYALLGAARLQNGDSAGARDAFQRALALDPHNPMALEGLQALEGRR